MEIQRFGLLLLFFNLVINYGCVTQKSPISKIRLEDLKENTIVFKGKVITRKYVESLNGGGFFVAEFIDNKLYYGEVREDTIRLNFEEYCNSINFSTHFEYIVIANPSRNKFQNFQAYEASFGMIHSSNQEKYFKKEVNWWEKYLKKKEK